MSPSPIAHVSLADLAQEECIACTSTASPALPDEQIALLKLLDGWAVATEAGVDKLVKTYLWSGFQPALDFACRIGELAERVNHHPEITVAWGSTKVVWWTHTIAGLHHNDFILAARCDLLLEPPNSAS